MAANKIGRAVLGAIVLACSLSGGCHTGHSADFSYQKIRQEIQRGKLDAALRDADAAYRRSGSKDTGTAWRFRVEKAHILLLQGSYTESLQLIDDDVPASLAHTEVAARRAMVRGLDYTFLQRFDAAEKELKSAEEMTRPEQPALAADVAQARGTLELTRKRYVDAANAFRRTLSLAREARLDFLEVNALGSLGNVAMGEEHYDEAIDWFKIALTKSEVLGTRSSEALALGNMGWNYQVVGDFENAETALKQAERISGEAGRIGNRVYWLTILGEVYYQQWRLADAEAISKQALSLADSMDDKATVTNCLNTLSEIELATGRVDLAEEYNRKALEIERAGLDQSGIALSMIVAGRVAASRKEYRDAEETLQGVIRDQSLETPLRWQAQARLARVYADEGFSAKAESQFHRAISTIENARAGVHRDEFRVSFLTSAIEFYDDYVGFLMAQGRALDALRAADLARAGTLDEGLETAPKSISAASTGFRPQEIAQRLRAPLLFYWLGRERGYLWLVTPSKVHVFPLPPEAELDALVKSYGDALLGTRDPLETANADGRKLYETLVEPAARLIPKGSRVTLLPDGSLYGLNFETLIVPGPNSHYWIEDVTVTTANSLTLLASAAARPAPKAASLLLVGNTVSPNADFPALPQAAAEMQHIEKYFSEQRREVLSGGEATPAAYLSSKPQQFAYLHFVTHGTASRLRPLESAVILSRDTDDDSYKLYARDIVKRHLTAYLVTISACNGAGTREFSGEGLVGLSWAFLRAGAHNVIGALWEVSDASTPQLMDKLYDGLSHGEDPAAALRAAKLSLLHSDSVFRKPYYWAPFQLYAGS
ncbi:MAG: CHAT domain-containing protein [Candidatus Acidiferrum sp.]